MPSSCVHLRPRACPSRAIATWCVVAVLLSSTLLRYFVFTRGDLFDILGIKDSTSSPCRTSQRRRHGHDVPAGLPHEGKGQVSGQACRFSSVLARNRGPGPACRSRIPEADRPGRCRPWRVWRPRSSCGRVRSHRGQESFGTQRAILRQPVGLRRPSTWTRGPGRRAGVRRPLRVGELTQRLRSGGVLLLAQRPKRVTTSILRNKAPPVVDDHVGDIVCHRYRGCWWSTVGRSRLDAVLCGRAPFRAGVAGSAASMPRRRRSRGRLVTSSSSFDRLRHGAGA